MLKDHSTAGSVRYDWELNDYAKLHDCCTIVLSVWYDCCTIVPRLYCNCTCCTTWEPRSHLVRLLEVSVIWYDFVQLYPTLVRLLSTGVRQYCTTSVVRWLAEVISTRVPRMAIMTRCRLTGESSWTFHADRWMINDDRQKPHETS